MRYLRSPYVIIFLMAVWWIFWLSISESSLNIFYPPSLEVAAQFGGFIACFLIGHAVAVLQLPPSTSTLRWRAAGQTIPFDLRLSLMAVNLVCIGVLIASLYLSGAFSEEFLQYFIKLRRDEATGDSLTGIRLLDVTTKAIVFPASYTITAVVLAARDSPHPSVLVVSVVNMLLFSYLWQVNYPMIHLFWFLVLYLLLGVIRGVAIGGRTIVFVLFLVGLLVAVAGNRFGGDVLGGVQRYFFGYHTAGFSFYDFHFRNPLSLLHDHTFGRTSLGFIEQVVEIIGRRFDLGYIAASSENSDYNNEPVDLGAYEVIEGNAFGTYLYGFYRDFNIFGIAAGGLTYGWVVTRLLLKSNSNWQCAAVFYVLAASWMQGMMVNPVEQAYFWFSILFIGALGLINVNRGFRL